MRPVEPTIVATVDFHVVLTVAAGGVVAAQAPVNQVLSQRIGSWGAGTVNFAVGTLAILVITLACAGGFSGKEGAESPTWYYWIFGGLSGVVIVVTTLVTVRELGAGGVTAAVIAGQLGMSVVLDRVGCSASKRGPSPGRGVLGIALLAAGTVLVVRD
jgi:bacterial/archaeal transporter family-2 protein